MYIKMTWGKLMLKCRLLGHIHQIFRYNRPGMESGNQHFNNTHVVPQATLWKAVVFMVKSTLFTLSFEACLKEASPLMPYLLSHKLLCRLIYWINIKYISLHPLPWFGITFSNLVLFFPPLLHLQVLHRSSSFKSIWFDLNTPAQVFSPLLNCIVYITDLIFNYILSYTINSLGFLCLIM